MNFLQLCQRTREKCAITGTGPAAVTGQSGEMLRLVNWVNEAWMEIQGAYDNLAFMWARGTFSTQESSPGVYARDYDLGTGVQRVDPMSFTAYLSSEADEWRLYPVNYTDYRAAGDLGTETADRPTRFVLLPDRTLRLLPRPDDAYTLQFDYYRMPTTMVANTDTPSLEEEHLQWAIIYGAMRRYAMFENAPEALAESDREYRRVMQDLRRKHLPIIRMGVPLA